MDPDPAQHLIRALRPVDPVRFSCTGEQTPLYRQAPFGTICFHEEALQLLSLSALRALFTVSGTAP